MLGRPEDEPCRKQETRTDVEARIGGFPDSSARPEHHQWSTLLFL